jgi:glycosyltransferase involved in cell wall biosynthesis
MASESRNFAEIIKHNETGILFPYSESGNFLYEALLSYLSNEDLRKKLMDNAKVCMDFNSWEKTANRYFDLFKNSLS